MKLILKTVTGKKQEVSVEPDTTILDVKKTLEEEYDMASLRLCFKGAILDDAKTVSELGLTETDTVVIAGKKRNIPKPSAPGTPAPPAQPPASSSTTETSAVAPVADASTPAVTPPPPATAPASAPAAVAPAPPAPAPAVAAPSAASIDHTQFVEASLIDELVAMGFEDRTQVALAMRAAFMNADRAVEYLCTGIPPHLLRDLTAAPVAHSSHTGSTPAATAPAAPAPASTAASSSHSTTATATVLASDLRSMLWTVPHFEEIRAVAQRSAESMPLVMQQMAQRHPQVYQLIEANPEEFLTIMSETGGPPSAGASATEYTGDETEDLMSLMPPELELSDADRTSVQQLVDLGGGMWDEQGALLVYLATQRNQELAASVLFEHGGVPQELLAQIYAQMHAEGEEQDFDEEGDE